MDASVKTVAAPLAGVLRAGAALLGRNLVGI
jgi:hypothetical protein